MSGFKNTIGVGTLAALQAAQIELERRLKENAKIKASRVIDHFGKKNQWPPEDVAEILGSLGLEPINDEMDPSTTE